MLSVPFSDCIPLLMNNIAVFLSKINAYRGAPKFELQVGFHLPETRALECILRRTQVTIRYVGSEFPSATSLIG
jgi:hypothetical protein